jgi:hypothetical protein
MHSGLEAAGNSVKLRLDAFGKSVMRAMSRRLMETMMKKIFAPIALALLVAAPGAAFAAGATPAPATKPVAAAAATTAAKDQSITGMVKSFDLKGHVLTLDNGIAYKLPIDFKDPGLKNGAKVTVLWHMVGKDYDATKVMLG